MALVTAETTAPAAQGPEKTSKSGAAPDNSKRWGGPVFKQGQGGMKMSEYPKRGRMSDDGKFYTHIDGSVHDLGHPKDHVSACKGCSVVDACNETNLEKGLLCGQRGPFEIVEGAYVPSDEEREACEMAADAIAVCPGRDKDLNSCRGKGCFDLRICVLRKYLSAHKQPDAWEAK